ncbi:MAG: DUF1730 domain-containing protein, partial [Rhizobiales bacterium]|nr:DUF1730 domain-containing protein [Hyphomicrobiales bacterium]
MPPGVPSAAGRRDSGRDAGAELRRPRLLSDPAAIKAALAAAAKAAGFDVARVVRPESGDAAAAGLAQFLAAGAHGDMAWMEDPRRRDPRALWSDVRSVVMLGMNYGPDTDPRAALQARDRGAVSVYAQGDDYHELIKPRLKTVARELLAIAGGDVKVFVDTAALMEKPLAAAAGIGWQGKHTKLVSRDFCSWLFLGAIMTTLEL